MPRTSLNSNIYRFEREPLQGDVYKGTTEDDNIGDGGCFNKPKKSKLRCCLPAVLAFLLMGSCVSIFSFIHVSENEFAYYDNVGSDKILYPGLHLSFVWNSDRLRFANISETLTIPILYEIDLFTEQNVYFTIDYTVNNITAFVKKIQRQHNGFIFEIIKLIQSETLESLCKYVNPSQNLYEITPFLNITNEKYGIIITNATFTEYKDSLCESFKNASLQPQNNTTAAAQNNTSVVAQNNTTIIAQNNTSAVAVQNTTHQDYDYDEFNDDNHVRILL